MKIRNLLIAVAMLSVLLCGAVGTAYAVLGVADDVAGQDLVIPFICGRTDLDASNTLNTLYTIAEVKGGGPAGVNWVTTDRALYTRESETFIDFTTRFTAHDLLAFDCQSDFDGQSVSTKNLYTVEIGGKSYLAGYVILTQLSATDGTCTEYNVGAPCTSNLDCVEGGSIGICDKTLQNRFVGWEYLVDLQKGFASGFNALSMEDGVSVDNLGEAGGTAPITAATFYPRIYVHNSLAQTWNWWILLAGRNELDCGGIVANPGRILTGVVCSPDEICPSFSVDIPFELNIIDMEEDVPQVATIPGYPKSAFAVANVSETFNYIITATDITLTGSINYPPFCGQLFPAYTVAGWSYQRAQSDAPIGGFNGSWDVVHPMHRNYCSTGAVGLPYIEGADCSLAP